MTTYSRLFDGGGGGSVSGVWTNAVLTSKSITFTQAGTVVVSMVGAGGSGAVTQTSTNGAATGGNSAPWARKKIAVSVGDVLTFVLGAGGGNVGTAMSNGLDGSASTVALNGATILTVQGGEGGRFATGTTTAVAATASATATGADFWVPGLRAGDATFSASVASVSGGAAPDLLISGLGRSPAVTAGNAPIGGSLGTDSGGIPVPWLVLSEWGFATSDGASATAVRGAPGRGGTQTPDIRGGMFAGGAGSGQVPSSAAQGGGGGAGGRQPTTNGLGGSAYAYVVFTPEE